jgi:hypothetical protein
MSFLEDLKLNEGNSKTSKTDGGSKKSGKSSLIRFSDSLTLRAVLAAVDHWSPQWAYTEAVNILCDDQHLVRLG